MQLDLALLVVARLLLSLAGMLVGLLGRLLQLLSQIGQGLLGQQHSRLQPWQLNLHEVFIHDHIPLDSPPNGYKLRTAVIDSSP